MTIDEIKRQMFIDSEEVCGNTMIDTYQAQEYVEQAYNKALDDFTDKLKSECTEHYIDCDPYFGGIEDRILYEYDIEEIAEELKAGGMNEYNI